MTKTRTITAGLMSVAACCAMAASALGQGYVPPTLGKLKSYTLPSGHQWIFPVMAGYQDPPPWQTNLYDTFEKYVGTWIPHYNEARVDPFGLVVSNGPSYSPPAPVASVQLIQYNLGGCAAVNRITPQDPPTFANAKAAADAYCATLCGSGFEMTDFDMNQWKAVCYNYSGKSYNVATWGGTRCEKTTDNGQVQACNPVTGLVQIRQNLNAPASACPTCDNDGDGAIALKDLLIERNRVYGPRRQGIGETYAVIVETGATVDQAMAYLTTYVQPGLPGGASVDVYEITQWRPGVSVDCNDTASETSYIINDILESNQLGAGLNQNRANAWCQARGYQLCATGALGSSIGHCRIRPDGVHVIRITAGYCMKCTMAE